MNAMIVLVLVVVTVTLSGLSWIALRVKKPSLRALGVVCRELCAVPLQEIEVCCSSIEEGGVQVPANWNGRVNLIRILMGYTRAIGINTQCFQEGSGFEALKIDRKKSSLDYEPRETLILCIVEESTAMRWMVIRLKILLWQNLASALCGQAVNEDALRKLVLRVALEYKGVEESMVHLTGMSQDDSLHKMLMERLGLSWNIYSTGA